MGSRRVGSADVGYPFSATKGRIVDKASHLYVTVTPSGFRGRSQAAVGWLWRGDSL